MITNSLEQVVEVKRRFEDQLLIILPFFSLSVLQNPSSCLKDMLIREPA